MKRSIFLVFTGLFALAMTSACGDDESETSGSTATTTSSSSSNAGGANTGGTGGAGQGGAGGGAVDNLVNGCDPALAEDHTADADTVVKFGGDLGSKYAPPCVRVKAGHTVTFSGNGTPMTQVTFVTHPLQGGAVKNGVAMPDASSPIPPTSTPQLNLTVTFPNAGAFPYYCGNHYAFGMMGAVFVDP
jgi:plastocyanin